MKILFLNRLYSPHVGGVEKHIEEIFQRLLKKGHTITIVTEKYNKNLKNTEGIKGAKIFRIPYPKTKLIGLFYIWHWLFKHKYLIKQADIIHTHDIFIWYLPFRFIYSNKPVFTTFHGWEGIYPIPKRNIWLNQIAAKLSWGNMCAGTFIEKHYRIKADHIYYTAITIPKKVTYRKDPKRLVYVGRLDHDTGLPLMLKALSCLKGYKIDFCGDGLLKNECKEYGQVRGFTNPKPFYQKAPICISAGLTSILEALSYKCLVITTYNNPLKKDYLTMTPFKNWIIISNTPEKLAERIKYYSRHPNKAKNKIQLGYKWAKTQTWDNLANQYLKLWKVS